MSLNGDTASASDHRDRQKTTRKPKKALGLSSLSKTQHFRQFFSCVSSTKDSTTSQQSADLHSVPTYTLGHSFVRTIFLHKDAQQPSLSWRMLAVWHEGIRQQALWELRLDLHSLEAPWEKGNTGTLCKSGIKSWCKERINMSRVRRRFWAKVGVSKVAFSPLITETKGKGHCSHY